MKYFYGLLLILWLVINQIIITDINIISIASLLGVLCLFIIKEKFVNYYYSSLLFAIIILLLTQFNDKLIVLAGITILDLAYFKKYTLGAVILAISFSLCLLSNNLVYSLNLFVAAFLGFILGEKDLNEKNYLIVLDEERRLRYRLEEVQNELINSRREIEHLTEIRERNRIAHEIHDNIGHSIAGVIFQIEGAKRIIHKDTAKLEEILKLCSKKLSEALELTRNTVYNIKSDKKIGLDSLEKILEEIKFCTINFEHTGDFNLVSATNMKILEANIREALTNAVKYSNAKNLHIKIDIGKKNIRLYYKDDGIGCNEMQEGLGLTGMRERVKYVGGTIAIDGSKGFLIVCNLPVRSEDTGEGDGFEITNS